MLRPTRSYDLWVAVSNLSKGFVSEPGAILPDILGETLAQTSLTVAWCLAGVTTWILGSRRRDRPLWWLGAALLGIVLLKLLLVDRQFVGNITGIVSFVVVGLLLIIVGRIAPTPPRSE